MAVFYFVKEGQMSITQNHWQFIMEKWPQIAQLSGESKLKHSKTLLVQK